MVDWGMVGAIITAIAALVAAVWSLYVLCEQDKEYVSLVVLLSHDLQEVALRSRVADSCLPLTLPALELVLARGFSRRIPSRLRDRVLTVRSVIDLVNLDNEVLWRAALSPRAASADRKPPEVLAVEDDRNEKMLVLKAAVDHVLAEDIAPILKREGVKPGTADPMWEEVVAKATAGSPARRTEVRVTPELQGYALIFRSTHQLLGGALAGVTPEQALARPDGGNPILWIAGHIVTVRANFVRRLGGSVDVPWAKHFTRGGKVCDEASWPSLAEALAKWDEVHAAFMARLETVTAAQLAQPVEMPGLEKTLLGALGLAALHDSYHIGQLAAARRRFGLDRLVG